jgi:hypothetical protein
MVNRRPLLKAAARGRACREASSSPASLAIACPPSGRDREAPDLCCAWPGEPARLQVIIPEAPSVVRPPSEAGPHPPP